MRLYLLLHDDGPEQGVAMPLYPSSETYWGCTLGPCSPGVGTPFEGAFSERRGLALRRFLLTVAPHVAENPLQYHLVASDSASVRAACDQMAAVGWEMLVQSYGSGFNLESSDAAYIARVKSDVTYCRARGVEVGGYDLIGWTRDPGRGWAALDASGGDSGDACFASGWADFFTGAALAFANATGVSVYETDGPYAGYGCSSTAHTHHAGAGDSVQKQTRIMAATYTAFRNAGFHVNAPDSYMIHGASKMGIGYNEGGPYAGYGKKIMMRTHVFVRGRSILRAPKIVPLLEVDVRSMTVLKSKETAEAATFCNSSTSCSSRGLYCLPEMAAGSSIVLRHLSSTHDEEGSFPASAGFPSYAFSRPSTTARMPSTLCENASHRIRQMSPGGSLLQMYAYHSGVCDAMRGGTDATVCRHVTCSGTPTRAAAQMVASPAAGAMRPMAACRVCLIFFVESTTFQRVNENI